LQETIEPGLLTQLLRLAPKLRVVELTLVKLGVEELKEMAALAKQRTCMRRLEELEVKLSCHNGVPMKIVDLACFSLAIHCPRLHTIFICPGLC
jgi:hypothetical protein